MAEPPRVDTPKFRETIWPRAVSDYREHKDKAQVGVVVAITTSLVALARFNGDRWWQTALGVAAAGVVGAALGYGFIFLWHLMRATKRQRDDARTAAAAFQADYDERGTPRITVEAQVERFADMLQFLVPEAGALVAYSYATGLWVRLRNHGPGAQFAARLLNISGGSVPFQYDEIEDVAWESTTAPINEVPRGGRTRILIGTFARYPDERADVPYAPCFWFRAASSAIWSPDTHQNGWRLRTDLLGSQIEFDLEIVNVTFDKLTRYRGTITFPTERDGEVEFRLEVQA